MSRSQASGIEQETGTKWHCCVVECRQAQPRWVPRSDGEGEFGEGRRKPVSRVDVQAEFVMATAHVPEESVSNTDHLC